jgi:ABC-type amino acid transport system permease subunit
MEAGRSLGMTSAQTMRYVILPQAFKRVLPPLAGSSSTLSRTPRWSLSSPSPISPRRGAVVSSTFSPFEVWFTVVLAASLYGARQVRDLALSLLISGASSGGEIRAATDPIIKPAV